MPISINDTKGYHQSEKASLGWEQTISECLRDVNSPYMQALKKKRTYPDILCNLFSEKKLIKPNGKILEVGGGYGNLAYGILSRFDDIEMTMVDLSPVFIERQKEKLSRFGKRVKFILSDIFEFLKVGESFDLIIANEVLGDFPAIVDIDKGELLYLMDTGKTPDNIGVDEKKYLFEAKKFVDKLNIPIESAPDDININTGAIRFIEEAMKKTDSLWISEHSSDYEIPDSMMEMLRDARIDTWPKKIILFGHTEVTQHFGNLKRFIEKSGFKYQGGSLFNLLGVRTDDEIRYILLSGSIANETHEIIGEFVNHVVEYQWMLVG